jgi:hypothetical protein
MPLSLNSEVLEGREEETKRAIHELQRRQFVCSAEGRLGPVLRVLQNPVCRNFVAGYFSFAGYEFVYDDVEAWYGIIPRPDEVSTPTMTPTQTLVLFALAIHWQKCADRGDLDARASAFTTLNALWADIEQNMLKGKSPALDASKLLAILKSDFEVKGIVALGEMSTEDFDFGLSIRPFVRLLAGEDALERLVRFVDSEEVRAARVQPQREAELKASDEEWDEASKDDGVMGEDDEAK